MPFCPQCGVDNPAAARFCDQCGAELIAVPLGGAQPVSAPATPQAVVGPTIIAGPSTCPQCGTAVIPGEAFCDACGASLLAGTSVPTAAPPALPYAGVPAQPNYPPPQPVAAPPPPLVTPPVVPPAPPQGRPSLAGVNLVIQSNAASLPLPASGQAVIGRADPVSNVFPDIDLTNHGALERGVGRRHARIFLQNGLVLFEDLNSTNGTFLNTTRLQPGQPQTLRTGDEIRLGTLVIKVQM
ncbi:FHA domain-containing protein [Candidatus Oscillochloris fontis]|uniref:FHA domain-containing protein n=1 Tax=Candidatus Oscillochloris fontis TaxID=2496868 RepID=UPI00101CE8BF|nr:FHA domain-containing protein [Candidatus Oscillochloris fontis]